MQVSVRLLRGVSMLAQHQGCNTIPLCYAADSLCCNELGQGARC